MRESESGKKQKKNSVKLKKPQKKWEIQENEKN